MGHLTNLDLREGKASPYEGGFRVPFIIRWPAQLGGGQRSLKLINSADFLATFADLFRVDLPDEAGEDSFSFLDVLTGASVDHPRQHVALLSRQAHSYVQGDWKLIDFSYSRLEPQEKAELYNLKDDPTESNDLSNSEQDVMEGLQKNLKSIVEEGRSRSLRF
jgi:arylsulfatase A-like enzyme